MSQNASKRALPLGPDAPPPIEPGGFVRLRGPKKIEPREVTPASRFSEAPAEKKTPAQLAQENVEAKKAEPQKTTKKAADALAVVAIANNAEAKKAQGAQSVSGVFSLSARVAASGEKKTSAQQKEAQHASAAPWVAKKAEPSRIQSVPQAEAGQSAAFAGAGSSRSLGEPAMNPRALAALDAWQKSGASWEQVEKSARKLRKRRAEGHLVSGAAAVRNVAALTGGWVGLFLAFAMFVGLYAQLRATGRFSFSQIGLRDSPTTLLWCALLGGFAQGVALALKEDAGPRKWLPVAAVWASMGPTWLAAEAINRWGAGQDALGWAASAATSTAALLLAWRSVFANRSTQPRQGLRGKKSSAARFFAGPSWVAFCVAFGVCVAAIEAPIFNAQPVAESSRAAAAAQQRQKEKAARPANERTAEAKSPASATALAANPVASVLGASASGVAHRPR